ncbi:MAG: N-acetyl-gamma-glutamyl-phosphate reductase [Bacteroidales bacterium]|nr:N-acetyl-gamma-glutamyl-phosphate reductase [Bacteroidales bacterium]
MIRVGIIGAAGYTAGELIRILMNHPHACLSFAQSESHAGEPLWTAHQDLVGDTDMSFCKDAEPENADVIFICSGHGRSKAAVHALGDSYRGAIIDLSNDFRLKADAEDFVYGLPEAFRGEIAGARHIANPGCFATCIQLALLPLASRDILSEIHVTGITGSTGAGQKPSDTTNFSWRDGNTSVYKPFVHQHLGEISETFHALAPSWNGEINFIPVRGCFTRGMMVSSYLDCALSQEEASALYKDYYSSEPFVTVVEDNPDVKMVVNTNKCVLSVHKYGKKLHIISVIDNLVKGASGQAVQNMNLVFGLGETAGLKLKATRF